MRKKIFTFLLALVAGIGSMWAQNPSGSCGTDLTWEFNPETGVLAISGTGTTMTSIGWVSGVWNDQVTSVTFPESLTKIEVMSAFQGFGMSTITLPENLTVLGYAAFDACAALTSIKIPAGVSTIQGNTFSRCSSLATVILPASITSIDDYAFADCPKLKYFYSYAETPPTCESNKVFWDYNEWEPLNLSAATLYVPYSSIADYEAANGWNSFGTIAAIPGTEPDPAPTVYNSGSVALRNLKVGDILMAGVTLTDDSESKVKFVKSRLKQLIFIRDYELTVANFVNSLQTPLLGENAVMTFQGGVTITPINEEREDGNAWVVTEINVAADIPVTLAGITYSGIEPANPSGSCGENLTWEFNTETGALTISGTGAMDNYSWNPAAPWDAYKDDITSVSFPEGITTIGAYAFVSCDNAAFTTVTIPEGVTALGVNAFYNCDGIQEITIPSTVTTIEVGAIYDCKAVNSITSYIASPTNLHGYAIYGYKNTCTLYVPYNSIAAYQAADCWKYIPNIAAIPGTEPAAPTTPTVYNSGSVALSNLNVGDILMAGVTLTTEDNSNRIKFAANRVAFNGNKCETDRSFLFSEITPLLGENATISFGSGDPVPVIPINEVGDAGNAWEVTEVNTGDTPVTLTGITYSGTTPTPTPTVWTSLSVGDVIKVGDQLSPSEEWGSANDHGVIKPAWAPYTLLRANIVQEHEYDDPVVTEAEDGAYYVLKFTHPSAGTYYLLANSAKGTLLAATATSDGLEVTNVGDYYGTPQFTFAVHEPAAPTPTDEQVPTNEDPENPSYHYSTFFHSTQNYKLTNDGTQAFIADLSGSDLVLTKIAEGTQVIPANTAVIFRKSGSADPVVLNPTEENGVSVNPDDNSLKGVDAETAITSIDGLTATNCYVLSGTAEYGVGFYRINSENLKAHKAYVIYTGSAAPKRMRFVFNQEQVVTGIDNANADIKAEKRIENGQLIIIKNGVRYNVQGQIVR